MSKSKIQIELEEVTEVKPSGRRNETITDQGYLKRLCVAIQELDDDTWSKLSKDAQDWFNDAADCIEAKKDIPEFPDLEKPASSSNRRGSKSEPKAAELEVGAMVSFKTKRGKAVDGKVEEIDGDIIVVNGTDYEKSSLTDFVVHAGDDADPRDEDGDDSGPRDPVKGDEVELVTKRGRTVTGVVEEVDGDVLVVNGSDYDMANLTSVKILSGSSKPSGSSRRGATVTDAGARNGLEKLEETKSSGRRGSAEKDEKPAEEKKTRSTNGGVSVTVRIREMIVDNLEADKDKISDMMKKEGLEFKPATLDMTYGDTHKVIALLRDRKLLKG